MNFTIETSVPAITVLFQGLLSFFSPCVLPLVPLYVSYLAGGAKTVAEDGTIRYPKGKVLLNTLFFVLGVSFTFFLLGLGLNALGRFFSDNRIWFARISGIIMIAFGLYQFGVFGKSTAIEREHRLSFNLNRFAMNPFTALLLGFTFSFSWTPCVGPVLGSVLLMAGSAGSSAMGFLLIGVYTLGFVLPFLAVGFFTTTVLGFFKRHQRVVQYTVKIGAVLLIFMGIMTLTGFMNGITGYLSSVGADPLPQTTESGEELPGNKPTSGESEQGGENQPSQEETPSANGTADGEQEPQSISAPDFTLTDQYGNTHTLSDYKGKTVFLNFWATWCPPCQGEMPDIENLYRSYGENGEDLIVLGVAGPNMGRELSAEQIAAYLERGGYTFPVVMDETGDVFSQYSIRAYPTTFMIDKDGNLFGYVESALTGDMMEGIVKQTMDGVREQ